MLDHKTNGVYRVALDKDGTPVEEDTVASQELDERWHRYGKLDQALYQSLQQLAPTVILPIAIWATEMVQPCPLFGDLDADGGVRVVDVMQVANRWGTSCQAPLSVQSHFDPFYDINRDCAINVMDVMAVAAAWRNTCPAGMQVDESSDPVSDVVNYLRGRGYEPAYVSTIAPVIYVEVPLNIIPDIEALSQVAAIEQVYEHSSLLNSAARTIAAPWTWIRGFTGQGARVAVVERAGVDFDHSALAGSVSDQDRYYRPGNPNFGSGDLRHATQVAGVVASRDGTSDPSTTGNRGIAPDAHILSGNAGTFWSWDLAGSTEWAIDHGADIINYSWGHQNAGRGMENFDRMADWYVWHHHRTLVVAAGNGVGNDNVTSPAKGYNVIAVGAKDDRNTAQTEGDVADDVMACWSSHVDPESAHDDREKPEVVAVGQSVTTTSVSNGWATVSGTSFAAPAVAGEAALMISRMGWLDRWPETVKAVIIATARWNAEGDARLSDRDGAGGVDTTAADNTLLNYRTARGEGLYENDFPHEFPMDIIAGQRIRVAISWNSSPESVSWWRSWETAPLQIQLDLMVWSPAEVQLGS